MSLTVYNGGNWFILGYQTQQQPQEANYPSLMWKNFLAAQIVTLTVQESGCASQHGCFLSAELHNTARRWCLSPADSKKSEGRP